MSMLDNQIVYAPLKEDTKYKAVLVSYTENPSTTPESQGSITFNFKLEDGRIVSDRRQFPVGVNILAEQLFAQLQLTKPESMVTLFNNSIKKQIAYDMWAVKKTMGDSTYTNIQFRKPLPQADSTAPAIPDNMFH